MSGNSFFIASNSFLYTLELTMLNRDIALKTLSKKFCCSIEIQRQKGQLHNTQI